MFRDELWKKSGIEYVNALIVRDPDWLWRHSGVGALAAEHGFVCHEAPDSLELRWVYEKKVLEEHEKCVILYAADFLPWDIAQNVTVFNASYDGVFGQLDTAVLRTFRNINFDLLSVAYRELFSPLGKDDTEDFCCGTIWNGEYLRATSGEYLQECDALLQKPPTRDDWMHIADRLGFIQLAERLDAAPESFREWYDRASAAFLAWMQSEYRYLSGTPTKRQPFLMNQALDYIRRNNSGKAALVVMDGMSFADFHMILRDMARSNGSMRYTGLFSFMPSITSVARQSLFSGKLPAEHPKPFDLANEEKQFRAYWQEHGVKDHEIYFAKAEEPDWPDKTRVAGIVVNIVDDLMHSELQGNKGLYAALSTWLDTGKLARLIWRLAEDGFSVYMTADHGNTAAIAQGRFSKPSIILENASRRAAIYQAFAGAEELDKFSVVEYTGPYMPKGYRYFAFAPHTCYGQAGTEYISHGGLTIEEMIVPFVRIGD